MGIVWALLCDIFFLAAVLFGCFFLRGRGKKVLRAAATVVIVLFASFAAYQCELMINEYLVQHQTAHRLHLLKVFVACCLAIALVWRPKAVFRAAEGLVLIMTPLLPIAGANMLWDYRAANLKELREGSSAGVLPTATSATRVIWIVFDELDERLLFEHRPERVQLHAFDALRQQSLYAEAASSPNGETLPSLQSLILGGRVGEYVLKTSDVRFKFAGTSEWESFAARPNVFSRARDARFNTGLSGWHHPYCRMIGKDLSDCAWHMSAQPVLIAADAMSSRNFLEKAIYILEWEARRPPFVRGLAEPDGNEATRRFHRRTLEFVGANGQRMLRNRNLNLVFIHFNIPHPPGIPSAARAANGSRSNYVDNLRVADDWLARLRGVLESTGDWDRSTILVSSDHPFRPDYWENPEFFGTPEMVRLSGMQRAPFVPFLLKLPHQQNEVTYTRKFDTVISGDLLLAALKGQVTTPEEAKAWLDARAECSFHAGVNGCR